jgi:hypothetical protein
VATDVDALIDLTPAGRVRVRYRGGGRSVTTVRTFLEAAVIPQGFRVKVDWEAGAHVIGHLVDLLDAHQVEAVQVSAARAGRVTDVGPVTALTARVWRQDEGALGRHPVVRALAPYAPNGDPVALGVVLARVFDPRWYTDPDRPDRTARLEAAFGLEPKHDGKPRYWRSVLERCWMPPDGARLTDADFYGRLYAAHRALGRTRDWADRLVGRHFLKALTAAWLDAFAGRYKTAESRLDAMFVPGRLFDATANRAVAAAKAA